MRRAPLRAPISGKMVKFAYAHGGTVFLDEIADLTSATQAKILRLIQEQQFERVGGTQPVQADVRVIAATNKNLPQMVADGSFRQDLYYRVNGFTIELPPLRNRHGDVALLTNYFVQRFNREIGRNVRAVAPEALQWLQGEHLGGQCSRTAKHDQVRHDQGPLAMC